MKELSSLPQIVEKRKKRLGRGTSSGAGAKSGRGTTRHQAAREDIPLHFEGGQGRLVKKFPLLRGKGKNKSVRREAVVIYSGQLESFKDGQQIDRKFLLDKGLLDKQFQKYPIKIILKGTLTKKLTVMLPVSGSVKKLIEKAGGEVK